MNYINSTAFALLINGSTSPLFKADRGIRQGCPLSPFLFLLVAEGLSRILKNAVSRTNFKGIVISLNSYISHMLFVIDIVIFCEGNPMHIENLVEFLSLFSKAIRMYINNAKSSMHTWGLLEQEKSSISHLISLQVGDIGQSFKYLGFTLKPNDYRKNDWLWLLAKIEKKIPVWSNRWLSRAGGLVLIEVVFKAIHVYWSSLAWIPKGIIGESGNSLLDSYQVAVKIKNLRS
jgi:hypothetical protein